uniref:Transposase n=1 Tax=Strongyloides papillosus TaxID=174720 RepID=A0A0N5BX44_STREA
MKSITSEVEKNVKIAIQSSDFPSILVDKVKEVKPRADENEVRDLAKTAVNAIIEHKFRSHKEIYEMSEIEDKRKKLRNESKRFKVKESNYPSADAKFLSVLYDKLQEDIERLENQLSSLKK